MGYSEYLRELLRPLGVYDLTAGSLSNSELEAMGTGLDGAETAADYAQRECITATAEEEGLSRRESLFAHRPVQVSVSLRREAIHALFQPELAGIDHACHVISPEAIEPIQILKTKYLGSRNPRLHTDEVLIALSVSAATDKNAQLALDQLPRLAGCQAHTSVMVGSVDKKQFKKLSIQATFEAKYENSPIFFKESGV